MVIGANPTDGHPVFASRMKKRLRQGAGQADRHRSAPHRLVRSPHIEADHHLPLKPGTNVAVLTALAHVIVTEGLSTSAFIRERCDWDEFEDWAAFVAEPRHSPEATEKLTGVPPPSCARRPALCHRRQRRDLLRPRRHRAQPGLDHGDGDRQPRHGDRQYRPRGRRREPAARPEQRPGLLRHGLVPARAAGLSPRLRRRDARACSRSDVGREARS
jgi:hypothetical protein